MADIVQRRIGEESTDPRREPPIQVEEKVNSDGTDPFASEPQMGRENPEGHPKAYLSPFLKKETSKSPFAEGEAKGESWPSKL